MDDSNIFRGIKKLLVLNIIRKGPAHGSEIHRILADRYDLDVPKPVVYMVLRRLEELGFVASKWELTDSGPIKRVYHITEEGLEFLRGSMDYLKKLRRAVDKLITELTSLEKDGDGGE